MSLIRRLFGRKGVKVVKAPRMSDELISGIRFRVWNNVSYLPMHRTVKYLGLKEQGFWRVQEPTVGIYNKKLKDFITRGSPDDLKHALALIDYMEELRGMQTTLSVLMEYVDVFIMLDGEGDSPEPQYKAMKEQLAKDPDILDFFLTISVPLLELPTGSQKDTVIYLKDSGRLRAENRLLKLITRSEILNFGKP